MAHVQQKGGKYYARWNNPDGREVSIGSFKTKKAAQAYLDTEVVPKLRKGQAFDPSAGRVRFRDVATDWLDSRHDLKPRTLTGYREMLAPAATRRGDMRKLGIDAVFGGYPVESISRAQIDEWIGAMVAAGKKPSTIRHAYFVVRQVLRQAVHDNRIPTNPADNVRLPRERNASGGKAGRVDDPDQFLTAAEVTALVDATPYPYNVLVHVAAWAGLRAGELAGLQIGDVSLIGASGTLHVHQTIIRSSPGTVVYDSTKTDASRRRVPLMPETVELLREYLRAHPRADDPTAPLFPAFRLGPQSGPRRQRPRGSTPEHWRTVADRQVHSLAALTVPEATARLVLDWDEPLRHLAFYKAVFRPAVLRAGLSADLRFHSLRHTYVSACIAAGIEPLKISRYVGHSKVTTTLDIYTHLFDSDHADEMAALGAMATPTAPNVFRLRS